MPLSTLSFWLGQTVPDEVEGEDLDAESSMPTDSSLAGRQQSPRAEQSSSLLLRAKQSSSDAPSAV